MACFRDFHFHQRRWLIVFSSLAVALIAYSPAATATDISACAAPLLPGLLAAVSPANPVCSSGTLVADMVSPFSYTTTAGTTSGEVVSAVFRERGGDLDFYYQIDNGASSATEIERDSDTSFLGFLTSVAVISNGGTLSGAPFVDGSIAPFYADRDPSGSVIGFNFGPFTSSGEIGAGQDSEVVIIATNAQNFQLGNTTVSDGGAEILPAYEPAPSAVPEPKYAFLALTCGGGLLLLAGFRRKLKN